MPALAPVPIGLLELASPQNKFSVIPAGPASDNVSVRLLPCHRLLLSRFSAFDAPPVPSGPTTTSYLHHGESNPHDGERDRWTQHTSPFRRRIPRRLRMGKPV